MGVGAVTTYLIADEVERNRCGIGCVLEDSTDGWIRIGKVMRGGAADSGGGVEVGDIIEKVDHHVVTGETKLAEVSAFIKGMEGSIITLQLRKSTGESVLVRLLRQRVPGSKAEMLGALWQARGGFAPREKKVLTVEDKMDKLEELRRRGNLTEKEYEKAKYRLLGEQPPPPPDQGTSFLNEWWNALKEDVHKLTVDPEVEKRKAQLRAQRSPPISPPNMKTLPVPPLSQTPDSPAIQVALNQKLQHHANLSPTSQDFATQDEHTILQELVRRGEQENDVHIV